MMLKLIYKYMQSWLTSMSGNGAVSGEAEETGNEGRVGELIVFIPDKIHFHVYGKESFTCYQLSPNYRVVKWLENNENLRDSTELNNLEKCV